MIPHSESLKMNFTTKALGQEFLKNGRELELTTANKEKAFSLAAELLKYPNHIAPSAVYEKYGYDVYRIYLHYAAIYSVPTQEKIDFLNKLIDDFGYERTFCVEIGAAQGYVGNALGIKCTDSYAQDSAYWREYYKKMDQPVINYGKHVRKITANRYVERYIPDLVLGCWVSHKFDPKHPERKGFGDGIDFEHILQNCKTLVLVGNDASEKNGHSLNPIMSLKHETYKPKGLLSRSESVENNFVKVWKGKKGE